MEATSMFIVLNPERRRGSPKPGRERSLTLHDSHSEAIVSSFECLVFRTIVPLRSAIAIFEIFREVFEVYISGE